MNSYFEQMILSASPMELVRLTYEQAIYCVRDAREHLRQEKVVERSKAIMKAYALVTELLTSLDEEKAPAMSAKLRNLYLYVQGLLLRANCEQIEEPLAEAQLLLGTLAEAWKQVPDLQPQTTAARAA